MATNAKLTDRDCIAGDVLAKKDQVEELTKSDIERYGRQLLLPEIGVTGLHITLL